MQTSQPASQPASIEPSNARALSSLAHLLASASWILQRQRRRTLTHSHPHTHTPSSLLTLRTILKDTLSHILITTTPSCYTPSANNRLLSPGSSAKHRLTHHVSSPTRHTSPGHHHSHSHPALPAHAAGHLAPRCLSRPSVSQSDTHPRRLPFFHQPLHTSSPSRNHSAPTSRPDSASSAPAR